MKRVITFWAILFLAAILVGCAINNGNNNDEENSNNSGNNDNNGENKNNNKNEKEEPKTQLLEIKDYFPMKENTQYRYDGVGNEFASYDVYNDYIAEKKVQQRINNGGTVMASVVELKDGKLTKIYSRAEAYYRESLLNALGDEEILLMEPLEKGTTWTLKDSRSRTITDTSVDVHTSTGNYKAIEVTTESANGKNIDYYAQNFGLVKSLFISGESEITSTLSKIEENVPMKQTINFFYPNIDDGKIYYQTREISFNTNEITKQVLAEAYKEAVNNQLGVVFSSNTVINSLYLNKDQNVYIDLNQEFVSEMIAGAAFEGMTLQSIANTFGQYYNSERVYLTIDNNPYESGHISLNKGEYIKVETEDTIEIQ